ncbi:hypothetical protein [Mucilaginibacter glaciei]|uniref:Uncharacterized protein n=1 Tax=Mucilaginibacter glaciei TaxID=2772109 RepID=A0A926NRR5_9SPHI|nr:hypothetical protein [Mucilaginibacter glaciei]MBD1392715.1 hypothetical protein [Mucilaginibacter glaciei]
MWVKQDYIDKIISTRSPLLASDKVIGITTMHFNTAQIAADSLVAGVSYDNHNPGSVVLRFKPGKSNSGLPFGENELGYSTKNRDTSLLLYQYYQNKWVITPYVKALQQSSGTNLQEGIAYLINKNLFAGNYTLTDSLGKLSTVKFKNNGEVTAFFNFKKYTVENSFDNKTLNNLDQITFNIFSSDEKTYIFKIDGNDLNLFESKKDTKAGLLVRGRLLYKLVRLSDK